MDVACRVIGRTNGRVGSARLSLSLSLTSTAAAYWGWLVNSGQLAGDALDQISVLGPELQLLVRLLRSHTDESRTPTPTWQPVADFCQGRAAGCTYIYI